MGRDGEGKGGGGWRESAEKPGGNGVRRLCHEPPELPPMSEMELGIPRHPLALFSPQGRNQCHTLKSALNTLGPPAHATQERGRSQTPLQRLLPRAQLMHVSVRLQRVCVSVVSSCRQPTVSSALGDRASAPLTTG